MNALFGVAECCIIDFIPGAYLDNFGQLFFIKPADDKIGKFSVDAENIHVLDF